MAGEKGDRVIVITTPSGQIGHQVLDNLLESDEELRVIARDPSDVPAEIRERVEVVEGSHSAPAVVDEAFAGADAVFWLAPPNRQAPSVEDGNVTVSDVKGTLEGGPITVAGVMDGGPAGRWDLKVAADRLRLSANLVQRCS